MHEEDYIAPPKFSINLIRWFCKKELAEELIGNLYEFYAALEKSPFKKLKYWYQVMNYLRPSTIKSTNLKLGTMFIFNPLLTIRNLAKNRANTLINLSGFTLGLIATIFLYFYIYSELSYDSFQKNKENIYRVARRSEINGTPYRIGVTSGPFARALETDFPGDIKRSIRALPEEGLVAYGEKKFFEEGLLFVDVNFFEFFSYPLKTGNPASVLSTPNSVVLTKEFAYKYFGNEDPMGKTIEVDNEFQFIVSGVMDELPAKSQLKFDMVFSIELMEQFEWFSGWWNNSLTTYVEIETPEQAARITTQLPQFMDKYFGEDFKTLGRRMDLELEPFNEVYFNDDTRYDELVHGNLSSVTTLGVVALAILFIACFNYVNLSIAQSFMRAKEVGVRKILGVHRGRLILQFLGESLIIFLFSIGLAVGICELLGQAFNSYFGLEVALNWTDTNVIYFFVILTLMVVITSGVYPAILLSSFKPVSILKGSKLSAGKNVGLRKGLVVTQFAISIFLIVSTIIISSQNYFINNKDLGFDKEATILIDLNNSQIRDQRLSFRNRLLANSNVKGITMLSGEPGGFHDVTVFQIDGIEGNFRFRTAFADTSYLNVFDISLVAGRNFSADLISETEGAIIINESALAELGVSAEELFGKPVTLPSFDYQGKVIGIAKDFHFNSLRDDIEPMAIMTSGFHRRMAVKVNESNVNESLMFIDEIYRELSPNFPLSYDFMDQSLKRLYENEQKQGKVFSAFSSLSIFLACLGIFGLASYSSKQRQKELGIRKVLGATAQQIIRLIAREFILLVLISSIVALPAAWYFMNEWLGGFAYRISLVGHWWSFLLAGLVAALIALVTVCVKTYRAAVANPTESIRNE